MTDTTTSSNTLVDPPPIGILSLPYELFPLIFTHLPAPSIISLLSTCQTLLTQLHSDSLYRLLSSRYGITSLTSFPSHQTFRTVYTSLLYTYGPLLGLWASDTPFRGNIFDFRVVDGRMEGWEGIVGEVWQFPRPPLLSTLGHEMRGNCQTPEYWESVRIVLPSPEEGESTSPRLATVEFRVYDESNCLEGNKRGKGDLNASLQLVTKTSQSLFIYHPRPLTVGEGEEDASDQCTPTTSLHPEFPSSSSDIWYDRTRSLPHLKRKQIPVYDNSFLAAKPVHDSFLYGAPTRTIKPAAISVFPPPRQYDLLRLHEPPFIGIVDLRHSVGSTNHATPWTPWRGFNEGTNARYYPLRFPQVPKEIYIGPGEDNWTVESLEGLWLGGYAQYGTEVLFLEWDRERREIKAWKITGDVNVPRGALSWRFDVDMGMEMDERLKRFFVNLPPEARLFRGKGMVSVRGFPPGMRDSRSIAVAVTGKDGIQIRWGDAIHAMRYSRYKERDVASETVVKPGVRRMSSKDAT